MRRIEKRSRCPRCRCVARIYIYPRRRRRSISFPSPPLPVQRVEGRSKASHSPSPTPRHLAAPLLCSSSFLPLSPLPPRPRIYIPSINPLLTFPFLACKHGLVDLADQSGARTQIVCSFLPWLVACSGERASENDEERRAGTSQARHIYPVTPSLASLHNHATPTLFLLPLPCPPSPCMPPACCASPLVGCNDASSSPLLCIVATLRLL